MEMIIIVLLVVVIALLGFNIINNKEKVVDAVEEAGLSPEEQQWQQQDNQRFVQTNAHLERLQNEVLAMRENNKMVQDQQLRKMEAIAKVMTDKKSRGRYGEVMLEQILTDAYGEQSQIVSKQHKLKGGLVDVAIRIADKGILPIDAKFPMEYYTKWQESNDEMRNHHAMSFERQIKEHVKKISGYIDVAETTPYALMFVPSEAVFAEIQANQNLLEWSQKNKVYFASPTTLLAVVTVATQINLERDRVKNLPKLLTSIRILHDNVQRYNASWEKIEDRFTKMHDDIKKHSRAVESVYKKSNDILDSRDAKKLMHEELDQ